MPRLRLLLRLSLAEPLKPRIACATGAQIFSPHRWPAMVDDMSIANMLLVAVSLALLLLRLGLALKPKKSAESAAGARYAEPKLSLDNGTGSEQPHEVFGELKSTLDADHDADERYLRDEAPDKTIATSLPISRKVVATGVALLALLATPYAHPSLSRFRLLTAPSEATEATAEEHSAGGPLPAASVGEARLPGATTDQQSRAKELEAAIVDSRGPIAGAKKEADEVMIAPAVDEKKPPRSIEDESGHALDKFFSKLIEVETKTAGKTARILYFGDSIVASDFVSGMLRRKLQSRFGDGGHGYALVANAWPGWFHIDVSRQASAEWRVSTCVGPYAEDGLYGLGCASFTSRNKGVWSEFATASRDKWGRKVGHFELEYLKQPEGGALQLSVDGEAHSVLETAHDVTEVAWHRIDLPDGPHKLKIEAVDKRPVRVFGIRMERDEPGIQLSALGITGARARFLDKQDDAHFAKVLAQAKPDLVVLAFGSNEITDGNMVPMKEYRETLSAVMKQVEAALPEASLMLAGPPDMASKKVSQGHSRPMVYFIVKNQRELAAERGWAFWDQYRAMGGGGSMWAWMKAGLGSQDMFHPTGRGGGMLGRWQYLALMEAFEGYKAARR